VRRFTADAVTAAHPPPSDRSGAANLGRRRRKKRRCLIDIVEIPQRILFGITLARNQRQIATLISLAYKSGAWLRARHTTCSNGQSTGQQECLHDVSPVLFVRVCRRIAPGGAARNARSAADQAQLVLNWKTRARRLVQREDKGYFKEEASRSPSTQGDGSATPIPKVASRHLRHRLGDINALIDVRRQEAGEAPIAVYVMYNRPPSPSR